jgi:hypothetical protein
LLSGPHALGLSVAPGVTGCLSPRST